MTFSKNSYIAELNRKYKKTNLEQWDMANNIICEAISKLDKLHKKEVLQ